MPLIPGAEPLSHEGGPVGVLVIHGFTGSPKSMRPWAEHLVEAGFTVEMPRLPGHGTTWQDMSVTRWEDWYAEVDRVLTSLVSRCEQVYVMGLSMGGSLTLRLAEKRGSDIAGIVLVNPAVHSERKDAVLLPVLRHLVKAFPGVRNDIKKPGVDEGAYEKMPLHCVYSLQSAWKDIKADIRSVTVPVLLLHSREDHVVEPSNAAWILANVASTDVTEVVLENSYHVATVDNDAELIFERSVEFVHRVAGSSAQA